MIINRMAEPLMFETVWFDKCKYDEAEKKFEEEAAQQRKGGHVSQPVETPKSSLAEEIANARQHILNTLQSVEQIRPVVSRPQKSKVGDIHLKSIGNRDYETLAKKYEKLEKENEGLKKAIELMQSQIQELRDRVTTLEKKSTVAPAPKETKVVKEEKPVNSVVNNHTNADDDDDDIDLFGSDEEEDAAANQLREERLKAYENKKSKKTPLVAKSSVILDIKPWDDETDMKEMEVRVRQVNCDGLTWGASKLVPLAYGIKKLQIVSVVEDDKVSIDWLQETIQDTIDDLVQSVDIAAFNKL